MNSELMEWMVCGRKIGHASGWDRADNMVITLYDFVPYPSYQGPIGDCIHIDFEKGMIETLDPSGNVVDAVDLIESLQDCPIIREE